VVKVIPSLPVNAEDLTRRDQKSFGGEDGEAKAAFSRARSSEQSSESVSSNAD